MSLEMPQDRNAGYSDFTATVGVIRGGAGIRYLLVKSDMTYSSLTLDVLHYFGGSADSGETASLSATVISLGLAHAFH